MANCIKVPFLNGTGLDLGNTKFSGDDVLSKFYGHMAECNAILTDLLSGTSDEKHCDTVINMSKGFLMNLGFSEDNVKGMEFSFEKEDNASVDIKMVAIRMVIDTRTLIQGIIDTIVMADNIDSMVKSISFTEEDITDFKTVMETMKCTPDEIMESILATQPEHSCGGDCQCEHECEGVKTEHCCCGNHDEEINCESEADMKRMIDKEYE